MSSEDSNWSDGEVMEDDVDDDCNDEDGDSEKDNDIQLVEELDSDLVDNGNGNSNGTGSWFFPKYNGVLWVPCNLPRSGGQLSNDDSCDEARVCLQI